MNFNLLVAVSGAVFLLAGPGLAQSLGTAAETPTPAASPTADGTTTATTPAGNFAAPVTTKRAFGVLPNYRTAEETAVYEPISVKRKFYIGYKDSTDYPIFGLSAVLAGLSQATDQHSAYGQGLKGLGKRYASTVADQLIGNFLTESVMPSLLREDPRYFRRGHGGAWTRTGYAASRIFVAKTNSGNTTFNFAEVTGNAMSAMIGNAYYPGERHLGDNISRFYSQLATDAFSQVLKEFWPDVKRKYFSHEKTN